MRARAALGLLVPLLAACPATPYPEVGVDLAGGSAAAVASQKPRSSVLRFSVAAMQSPQDTHAAYSRLLERVGKELGVEIELVQRRTYQEVNDLLANGSIDAAIVCTGGYVELERRAPGSVEVVAVPVVHGRTTYHSYVIVPASSSAHELADLEGKRFAFTDELSLSGFAYPTHALRSLGRDPKTFFGSVLFTRNHDRSIEAVAKSVIDGAAVDSLVYEQLVQANPALGQRTRVVHRSPPYGVAPVVVSTRLPGDRRAAIRNALLGLDEDPSALAALHLVGFDRFALPARDMYRDAFAIGGARP
jgi:phosphonate transport system substrate-binding protein